MTSASCRKQLKCFWNPQIFSLKGISIILKAFPNELEVFNKFGTPYKGSDRINNTVEVV